VAGLIQGSIVWARTQCRHTGKWKERPLIIATRTEEISSSSHLVAIAASHSATRDPLPWPDTYIEIPHHPRGRACTKLTKRTVAICDWRFALRHGDILEVGGHVKPALLEEILIRAGLRQDDGPGSR